MNSTALTLALVVNLSAALTHSGRIDERLLCPVGAGAHAAQPAPEAEPAAPKADAPLPVKRQLIVSVGATTTLQTSSKRPIARVIVEKEGIIRVQPVHDDPSKIMITGLAGGITRLLIYDTDGREEIHDLGKRGK